MGTRYVITAKVRSGEHKGKQVWLHLTPEELGWWQWGAESLAKRFESNTSHEFKDALSYGTITGPAHYAPDPDTIEVQTVTSGAL